MSVVKEIVNDEFIFPYSQIQKLEPIDWSQGVTPAAIKQAVKNLLSPNFKFNETNEVEATGVAVYDELSKVLPFNETTSFFWKSAIFPLVSLLESSKYSISDQVSFAIYFYSRTLGFMGKPNEFRGTITLDGSPVEYTWVFPTQGASKPGVPDRPIVFIIEPFHPRSGQQLPLTDVLEYLTSPQGHLGMVDMHDDSMKWHNEIENFLFPHSPTDRIPDNRRYGLGFYLVPNGKLSLKTYYGPPARSSSGPNYGVRLHRRDGVFQPFRELLPSLHPSLLTPFNLVSDFFEEFPVGQGPTLVGCATDIASVKDCRFKIYAHTATGLSLARAQRFFTLGGRLSSPGLVPGLEIFRHFWHSLFPEANGSDEFDIGELLHRNNRQASSHGGIGGVVYYVDLKAGEDEPILKFFVPIGTYLPNDAVVAHRLQLFCDKIGYKDPLKRGTEEWVTKDITKSFNHRPLESMSGVFLQLSFGLKRKGWEVAQYYSPEPWFFTDNATNATC